MFNKRLFMNRLFSTTIFSKNIMGVVDSILKAYVIPLIKNLIPTRGACCQDFDRTTSATVTDFEGVINTSLIGESRFEGSRRVENLLSDTETFSTETVELFNGIDYIFSMEGDGSVTFSGAYTGTLNGVAGERVSETITTSTTSLVITVTGSVLNAQLERVLGTQTEYSEYVSKGTIKNIGDEQLVNGTFDTDTGWNKQNATIADGKATITVIAGAMSFIYSPTNLGIGKTYVVEIDASRVLGSGDLTLCSGAGNNIGGAPIITDEGTSSYIFKPTSSANNIGIKRYTSVGDTTWEIETFSIKEVLFDGANVDGVKYFDTDRAGVAIDSTITKGVVIEDQVTNLMLYSQSIGGASWNLSDGATATTDNAIAPDGTLTASTINFTSSSSSRVEQTNGGLTTGNDYTLSMWVRSVSGDAEVLLGTSASVPGEFERFTIGEDWERICLISPASSGTEYPRIQNGDSTAKTIECWGGQYEENCFKSSYIPTTIIVTKTADSLSYDVSNDIEQGFGSIYTEFECLGNNLNSPLIFSLNDSSVSDRISASITTDNKLNIIVRFAGSTQVDITSTNNVTYNTNNKVMVTYEDDGVNVYFNGIKVGTDTSCTIPTNLTTLSVGHGFDNTLQLNGFVKNINHYNKVLSEAKAIAFTESIYLQDENGDFITDENGQPIITE